MKVHDIIRIWDGRRGGYRVWQVTGIYLGVIHQENLIGLKTLDRSIGCAHGKNVTEMLVPEVFLYLPGVLGGDRHRP